MSDKSLSVSVTQDDSKFGSRKFITCLVSIFIAAGLVKLGVIADSSFVTITCTAILAYCGSNVAQKYAAPKAG